MRNVSVLEKVAADRNKNYSELFASLGDFAQQCKASVAGAKIHRMMNSVSVAANVDRGVDGGFAVPPTIADEIVTAIKGSSLAALCDTGETGAKGLVTPVVGHAPWDDSDGIVCAWGEELGQIDPSKLSLEAHSQTLNKLTALVPVTAELLEDTVGLDRFLKREVTRKLGAKLNQAIINGTGVGMPLGILNSPCLVSTAAASTLIGSNLTAMHSRWHSEPRQGVWLVSKSAEAQFLAAAGEAGLLGPGFTCLGLPIVVCSACSAIGDKGDIILADMKQYSIVMKTGGLRLDVSMHLWMDYDVTAFRFVLRISGQPWWSAPADPLHGSDSLSPFVVFDARA